MPIEPATPPVFYISKFYLRIVAYDSSGSTCRFDIDLYPYDFTLGNTTSSYVFKILTGNNVVYEDIFYNKSTTIVGDYYYDLGNVTITINGVQLKLKDTTGLSEIYLVTYSINGTTKIDDFASVDFYDNKMNSGCLRCKLDNKKFRSN